jgi:hypothetical protein
MRSNSPCNSSALVRHWLVAILAYGMLVLSMPLHAAPVALQNFNVDITQTSVSGLSSGGFMAVQFGVAYSSIVMGAGIIAGGPYYCAQGDVDVATRKCSCTGSMFSSCDVVPGGTGVEQLIELTNQRARAGALDPVAHMADQRIWMFSGTRDSVVPPPVMNDLYSYYRNFIPEANIRFRNDIDAEHAMPTDAFGNACDNLGKPFLNNCGFDAAGEMLRWIYGAGLRQKNGNALNGRLIEFDQSEFVHDHRPGAVGLADAGYVYVPANCDKNIRQSCRVHVAFHGCRQNADNVDDKFFRHAGYNQWAEVNNIIVLYPQTTAVFGRNPKACWDWFDFNRNDPDYAGKNGRQMTAVKAMIDRVAGLTMPPDPAARCFTASNAEHVFAGRAHDWFFLAVANGSNKFMGLNNFYNITTLKQTGPNFYAIGNCL